MSALGRPAWPQHERSGSWITDDSGNRLLAWHISGGVFNLGFADRQMAEAVAAVITGHDAGLWSMRSERRAEGEQCFSRLFPPPLDDTVFTPSASEAFEVACKLAKRHTGRPGLVSMTGGYYGAIGFAMAMDDPALHPEIYGPLAGPIPKARYGSVEDLEALVDESTAAVCVEAIQIPTGVREAPPGYLREVRRICDERGTLLICDEVQAGLYRSGDRWAFEGHRIVPDIVVTGKGLSGGYYPIGALSFSKDLRRHFLGRPPLHRSSFMGGEIAAQIAGLVADRYQDPALAAHVLAQADRLGSGLEAIRRAHPDTVVDLRGRGLIYGVQLGRPVASELVSLCWERGLFLHASIDPTTVVVMPPLVSTAEEIDTGLDRFADAVSELSRAAGPDTGGSRNG